MQLTDEERYGLINGTISIHDIRKKYRPLAYLKKPGVATQKPNHEPSPEEIAVKCEEIRAGWDETTRQTRMRCAGMIQPPVEITTAAAPDTGMRRGYDVSH